MQIQLEKFHVHDEKEFHGIFPAPRTLFMIGFGSVNKTALPIICDALKLEKNQIVIISPDLPDEVMNAGYKLAKRVAITKDNYQLEIGSLLRPHDFVLNGGIEVSSLDLILLAKAKGALYLDTCTEPWPGFYFNQELSLECRTNQFLRRQVFDSVPDYLNGPTAVMTHGVNPGIISHFAKKALHDVALANGIKVSLSDPQVDWAKIAMQLNVRTLHISEYDTQKTILKRTSKEFFNSWSVHGFVSEAMQPAEFGMGTHEKDLDDFFVLPSPDKDSAAHCKAPGGSVVVKSWNPAVGQYHGYMITHAESISLSQYLSVYDSGGSLVYRPSAHYCYRPCDAAMDSLKDLRQSGWQVEHMIPKVLYEELVEGTDHLGILLGIEGGHSYWFGSSLSTVEARAIVPHANATSMQVAAGVLCGMIWAILNPEKGVVEPEGMDSDFILRVVAPYMGQVYGVWTDWSPVEKDTEHHSKENHWGIQNVIVERAA